MNLLIIEDEVLAADKLEAMILRYNPHYQIVAKIRSVEHAVKWLNENNSPDLIFMDIHLLDGTCFDILKKVAINNPVIFTTAYDNYALKAFKLQSVDYLLKPVSFTKLEQAFQKLEEMQQHFQKDSQADKLEELLSTLKDEPIVYKSRFLVKSGSRLFPIDITQIAYFYSEDRITFLVTKKNKKYSIHHTLDELEKTLNPMDFFRINRQMIVQVESIQVVHKSFKGRLKIDLSPTPIEEVMVSSRRVIDFQTWLDR